MIEINEFKKKLGELGKNLSDEKITQLLQTQYQFANALFDLWAGKGSKVTETFEIKSTKAKIQIHKNNGNACSVEIDEFSFVYTKTYAHK